MVICGSSAHTVLAFVRPRFGTAPVEWDLAIVDPLLGGGDGPQRDKER
jgi:hypothetical protein